MALDSPSLIGMLLRARTTNWPSGLASMVVEQVQTTCHSVID